MNSIRYGLLALTLSTCLTGCQNNQTADSAAKRDTAATRPVSGTAPRCYAYASAQDTIRLTLSGTGAEVTGTLVYQLKEKDRNTGTLSGQLRGDTLFAEYTFWSEGLESVREVAFLIRNDRAVEGYGTVTEQNGKVRFSDRRALTFGSGFALIPTDCAP